MDVVHTLNERLGENIRLRRKEARMTQEQLAAELGVTWQMVSRIERGRSGMTVRYLVKLAKLLHCYPFELLEGLEAFV